MLINGFTIFAQILNFLILVALLRWVLYKPILRVMNQRQQEIQERWQGAEHLQAEAQRALETYQQQQQDLEQQRQALLAAVRAEADQERQRQMAQLRQEVADQRATWQADLRQEQAAWLQTVRQQVIDQTMALARQTLAELANTDLEQQMVAVVCERLRQLPADQHRTLTQALAGDQPIQVCSRFDLPSDLQRRIITTLGETFSLVAPVTFVLDPDLISGVALKLAGQEVVWSLNAHLNDLEHQLADALIAKGTAPADSA